MKTTARATTVLAATATAAATAAAATLLAAAPAQASGTSTSTRAVHAQATASAAVGVMWASDPALAYAQNGAVVTATRAGHVVATVTATSLVRVGTGARLTLRASSTVPFDFSNVGFVLEDTRGMQSHPDAEYAVHALGATAQTITITWSQVSAGATAGAVLWAPGAHEAALLPVSGPVGGPVTWASDPALAYAQQGPVVVASRGGAVVAAVAEQSLVRVGAGARLTLQATSAAPFDFSNVAFLLQDTHGVGTEPDAEYAVHALDGTAETVVVTWSHVSAGATPVGVLWAPGTHRAGAWPLS